MGLQWLAIYEKAFGAEHPWIATALNNLAGLYRDQGRFAEAEPLYKRSLAIDEKALGPDHLEYNRRHPCAAFRSITPKGQVDWPEVRGAAGYQCPQRHRVTSDAGGS